MTFAISYGLGGGPLHSRQFIKLMQKENFIYVKQAEEADIIIAHSAGCWLMPKSVQPKLTIYVGMPLNQIEPLNTWRKANLYMTKTGRLKRLRVKADNTFYMCRQPLRSLGIIRAIKTAQMVLFQNTPTIFIVNQGDPWPVSAKLDRYLEEQDWAFVNMTGSHDDIWENPGRYVEIIDHYARLLA